jgi:Activator of Hsp90 ATPase homolog 1-like protein
VAQFACDPDNAPQWYVNIRRIEWKTPPPLALGSELSFVAKFMGRELSYTYEVRELIRDERLVMSTREGPFPMETTYTFADTPTGGTAMTLRNRGEPSRFTKISASLMERSMRRANRKDLELLKSLLEARPPAAN